MSESGLHDESDSNDRAVLLMTTWNDGEAQLVRQLLDAYGIPCQLSSDVPHAVFPINVDGLGEVRILVAQRNLDEAREILAEHRRRGLEMVAGGRDEDEQPDEKRGPGGEHAEGGPPVPSDEESK